MCNCASHQVQHSHVACKCLVCWFAELLYCTCATMVLQLPSATSRATPDASPLGQHCTNGFKLSSTEPMTPRTARSNSGGNMPVRESISSQKHLERLQSARQSGSFKPVPSAGSSGFGASGGVSMKQFVEAVRGVGSVSAGPRKPGSSGTAGSSGLSRQSSFGSTAPLTSSR
jgi:hypothetical protein